jgi:hypothetical protein
MTETITVKALPTASRRTRNRIREHGPSFEIMRIDSWPNLGGVCWMLGTPLNWATGEREWFGWIPQHECEECE